MKIADGFVLRQIIDTWIVVPVGKEVSQSGNMLSLSETSALLWERLEQGADEEMLTELLCERYETDRETAAADVKEFLREMEELNVLTRE
ncbi:MAG: PqqD family protein [Peptococcaceae bacterium]|jgi:hypothetical protein|nr:PqqD family protein [Peptococcaceae bacterium]